MRRVTHARAAALARLSLAVCWLAGSALASETPPSEAASPPSSRTVRTATVAVLNAARAQPDIHLDADDEER